MNGSVLLKDILSLFLDGMSIQSVASITLFIVGRYQPVIPTVLRMLNWPNGSNAIGDKADIGDGEEKFDMCTASFNGGSDGMYSEDFPTPPVVTTPPIVMAPTDEVITTSTSTSNLKTPTRHKLLVLRLHRHVQKQTLELFLYS